MADPRQQTWDAATFAGARRDLILSGLQLTPAQRFEWLEDAIDFAHRSGATRTARDAVADGERRSGVTGQRRVGGAVGQRRP